MPLSRAWPLRIRERGGRRPRRRVRPTPSGSRARLPGRACLRGGMLLQHVVNRGLGGRGTTSWRRLGASSCSCSTRTTRSTDGARPARAGARRRCRRVLRLLHARGARRRRARHTSLVPPSGARTPPATTSTRCRCFADSSSGSADTRTTLGCTGGRTTTSGAGPPNAGCGASSPQILCAIAAPHTRCSRSPASTAPRAK